MLKRGFYFRYFMEESETGTTISNGKLGFVSDALRYCDHHLCNILVDLQDGILCRFVSHASVACLQVFLALETRLGVQYCINSSKVTVTYRRGRQA